jgi:hypothetical protein
MDHSLDHSLDHSYDFSARDHADLLASAKAVARARGVAFGLTDKQAGYLMRRGACFYCAAAPAGRVHRLDRLEPQGDYSLDNTTACCGRCHALKGCMDAETFIARCVHVDGMEYAGWAWPVGRSRGLAWWRWHARRRGLEFDLTPAQYAVLCQGACVYCKVEWDFDRHENDLMRRDPAAGFTAENCVSCCAECRRMRGCMPDAQFRDACRAVAERWHTAADLDLGVTRCSRAGRFLGLGLPAWEADNLGEDDFSDVSVIDDSDSEGSLSDFDPSDLDPSDFDPSDAPSDDAPVP